MRSQGGAGVWSGMQGGAPRSGIMPFVRVAQFFDRPAVIRAMRPARLRYFSRAGGAVRLTARRSMRRKKDPNQASPPGRPPYAHQGGLREGIWYGYDEHRDSVVIGPTLFKSSRVRKGSMTTPALHEHGGRRFNPRSGQDHVYPARPYMQPALDVVQPRLPQMYVQAFQKTAGRGSQRRLR